MKFRYFISYVMTTKAGQTGFGHCETSREKPITGSADIAAIEANLKEHEGFTSVTVLNWQRFEEQA